MLRVERHPLRTRPPRIGAVLDEIVTPRTNAAVLSAAEHLFAALIGASGLSLELAGDAAGRRLYARADHSTLRSRFAVQLGAAYPQAHIRPVRAKPHDCKCVLLS